jgi:hypothetical protein
VRCLRRLQMRKLNHEKRILIMAIDDPIDASAERIAAEERAGSPLSRFIPNLAALASIIPSTGEPLAEFGRSLLRAAGLWISKLEASRREYLMTSLSDEVRRVRAAQESLDESHRKFVEKEFMPSFWTAFRRRNRLVANNAYGESRRFWRTRSKSVHPRAPTSPKK